MKADASNEQRFITEVDAFEFITRDIATLLHSLDDWIAGLTSDLNVHRLSWEGLRERGALALQADTVNALLWKHRQAWSQELIELEATQALADHFDEKALLLVFGKFNAGKSSFCNFLADRFAAHGRSVQYFHVDAGQIVDMTEPFKEGATETTSRLQGVRLGDKLVLLDTPGLHSVTPENSALTQRFTDSADGVLWLTSSTSPGQVQELDELSRELHRNKPLLPVVTRSDIYDEDEVDGEIVKILCNKPAPRRALQEADIEARAKEKLVTMDVDTALLKPPVSISAYMAREQGQTPAAMIEAGFERLYAALLAIAEPALDYKRRKQAEILLHHLEENVLGTLHSEVRPLLVELEQATQAALSALEKKQQQIANTVWRRIVPTLPGLLDQHAAAHDVAGLSQVVSQAIRTIFASELVGQFADYVVAPDMSLAQIELDHNAVFEDIVIDRAGENGNLSHVAGVDYGRVHAALSQAIHQCLLALSSDAARQSRASIQQLIEHVERLRAALQGHERGLIDLKWKVRSESA